jgi:hypothetical protein
MPSFLCFMPRCLPSLFWVGSGRKSQYIESHTDPRRRVCRVYWWTAQLGCSANPCPCYTTAILTSPNVALSMRFVLPQYLCMTSFGYSYFIWTSLKPSNMVTSCVSAAGDHLPSHGRLTPNYVACWWWCQVSVRVSYISLSCLDGILQDVGRPVVPRRAEGDKTGLKHNLQNMMACVGGLERCMFDWHAEQTPQAYQLQTKAFCFARSGVYSTGIRRRPMQFAASTGVRASSMRCWTISERRHICDFPMSYETPTTTNNKKKIPERRPFPGNKRQKAEKGTRPHVPAGRCSIDEPFSPTCQG